MENIIDEIALIYVLHSGRNEKDITNYDLTLSTQLINKYKISTSVVSPTVSYSIDSKFIKSNHQCPICSCINKLIKYNHT